MNRPRVETLLWIAKTHEMFDRCGNIQALQSLDVIIRDFTG